MKGRLDVSPTVEKQLRDLVSILTEADTELETLLDETKG
jgi:hypothetical protein